MKTGASALKAVPLVGGILLLIFLLIAFMPPLVPLSRVTIEGCDRINVSKVQKYLEKKLVMGMIPTANSQFSDASKTLGPILDKISISKGFFFKATVQVVEKRDFFVVNFGPSKIKVDILGNLVEGSPPENSPVVLSVNYVEANGTQDVPTPSDYNTSLQQTVGLVLRSRKSFPATITEVFYNKMECVSFSNGKVFYLVAPRGFNPSTAPISIPSGSKRIYLENVQGIFAKTSQGSLIVFGDESNLEVKMGSVAMLLDGLRKENKPYPAVIKADIPYQVTVAP